MQSPLLTLHDPANARRYYASGLWRDETLYGLLERHAVERPDDFALRDGRTRLSWSALRRLVDAIAGRSARFRAEAGRAGRGLAAEPGRDDRGVSGLLAPGLYLQPVIASELHGRRDRSAARRARAPRHCSRHGYGADTRTADIFAAAAELPSLRRVYSLGETIRTASRRSPPRRRRGYPASRDEPGLGRLSRLHLGHDRDAERRHAFRQHAARQRARDGRGLGSRRAHDPAAASAR